MPNLSFYERQHLEKLIQQEASLKYIFDEYVRNVSILMSGWQDSGNDNVWIRNAHIEKGVEKELQTLQAKFTDNIKNYSIDAWNRSNRKTDDLIEAYIKDIPLNNVTKKGLFARNEEALKTFLKANTDGETMSDRVWKVMKGGKESIEHYLSSGISTGRSAALISQDMRQLLKDPDKLFRRIRNEEGKLVMSAPMKDYHPGTGVYRSSFMNAKRLAATETNMAYRTADHERWKKLDFILGIEVRRSNSNKGPCPVCDALVGRYPKDYKFSGWHPWCICYGTPILMDEDAFIDSLVNGTVPSGDFVQDIPVGAREYMEEQLQKGKVTTNSYLFKDNKSFFDGSRGNIVNISKRAGVIQNSIFVIDDIPVKGGGNIKIYNGVDKRASDYKSVLASCEYFAKMGKSIEITPKLHPKDVRYPEIYSELIGTKYEGKSPDFKVDGLFYEHEGFTSRNAKNALRNMLKNGHNQSDKIIIEDCGHKLWYYKKRIHDYIRDNKDAVINEVWLLKERKLIQVYKKAEAR